MANEITTTHSLAFAKGGVADNRSFSVSVTMTGTHFLHEIQNVGTTEEALDVGSISPLGYVLVKNLDTTNYVEVGLVVSSVFVPFARMNPGEGCGPFNAFGAAIYLRANTAACNVEVMSLEQ